MVALIVAGFIALLNVAVMMAVLGQTIVERSGGVTAVTVGGDRGVPGFTGLASGSAPHPVKLMIMRSKIAVRLNL